MFTCPEVDIHSVYVDGELPESFVRQYEEHVASCPECKKIQESLLRTRKLLKAESDSISLSKRDLDDSFSRLQARLSYSKISGASVKKHSRFVSYVKYAAVGVAAAVAVFAFLPSRVDSNTRLGEVLAKFKPVSDEELISPANRISVQLDGTLDAESISSAFGAGVSPVQNATVQGETVSSAPVVRLNSIMNPVRRRFAGYDLFMGHPEKKSNIPSFERYKSSNFHYYFPELGILPNLDNGMEKK